MYVHVYVRERLGATCIKTLSTTNASLISSGSCCCTPSGFAWPSCPLVYIVIFDNMGYP